MSAIKFTPTQKTLAAVLSGVASDVFGLTLTIPVMATYALYLGADPELLGLMFSAFTGGAFLSSFWVGGIADKYGKRFVFVYASAGAFAAFLGSALSQSYLELVIWRAIAGLFSGTIGTSYAYIADVVPDNQKAQYMSYVSATLSSCFVIGPLIGGGLAIFGIRVPYYAAAAFAFIALLNAYFFIVEPKKLKELEESAESGGSTKSAVMAEAGAGVGTSPTKKGSDSVELSQVYTKVGAEDEGPSTKNNALVATTAGNEHDDDAALVAEKRLQRKGSIAEQAEADAAAAEAQKQAEEADPNAVKPNPWTDWKALVVGGLGTFLNSCCYTALAVLVPLYLATPSFGIVEDRHDITDEESEKLALYLGYMLGMFGAVQVVTMLNIFPRINKKIGLVFTSCLGAGLHAAGMACIIFAKTFGELIPVYIVIALANGLIRPALPAFLGSIAPKGYNATYIALNSTFMNMAMMSAGQLTFLYEIDADASFLVAAAFSAVNFVMLLVCGFILFRENAKKAEEERLKGIDPDKRVLIDFFGKGMDQELFYKDLLAELKQIVQRRNLGRAVQLEKGQQLIREIVLGSLPSLPENLDDKMHMLVGLYRELGHSDWAEELDGIQTAREQGVYEFGIPGQT